MTAACAARVQRVYGHGPQFASSASRSRMPTVPSESKWSRSTVRYGPDLGILSLVGKGGTHRHAGGRVNNRAAATAHSG